MRFAIKGNTFTFDGRYLSHWTAADPTDNFPGCERLRSCADLSLYTYGMPTCADAYHVADEMLRNPTFRGR